MSDSYNTNENALPVLYDQEQIPAVQDPERTSVESVSNIIPDDEEVSEIFTTNKTQTTPTDGNDCHLIGQIPNPKDINSIAGEEIKFIQKVEQAKEDQIKSAPNGSQ